MQHPGVFPQLDLASALAAGNGDRNRRRRRRALWRALRLAQGWLRDLATTTAVAAVAVSAGLFFGGQSLFTKASGLLVRFRDYIVERRQGAVGGGNAGQGEREALLDGAVESIARLSGEVEAVRGDLTMARHEVALVRAEKDILAHDLVQARGRVSLLEQQLQQLQQQD